MFAFKIGAKSMNLKALSIYKSKLAAAWIAAFLSVTQVAHLEI
jgi:hypothetical protein